MTFSPLSPRVRALLGEQLSPGGTYVQQAVKQPCVSGADADWVMTLSTSPVIFDFVSCVY